MTDPPDDHLWRLAGGGDADAFGVLYQRHGRAVREYCLRRTGDPSAAEDLTSMTFLEAWRVVPKTVLQQPSARPLLFGIATNVIGHRWRSRRRHAEALGRLRRLDELRPDHDDDSDARLDAARQLKAMRQDLDALPRREREVLALVALAELTYEETAAALDLPVGTVRSRLSRARGRLTARSAIPSGHSDAPLVVTPTSEVSR